MQFQFLMSVFGCHFSMHRFIYLAFAATSILKCITRWRTRRRRTKTTKKQQLAFIRNEESDSSPPSCGLYVEINFQLFPCTHTVRTRPWLMPTIPCPHPFPSFPLRPHCLHTSVQVRLRSARLADSTRTQASKMLLGKRLGC